MLAALNASCSRYVCCPPTADADLVLRGLLRLLTAIVAGRDHLKAQLGSEKGANMVQ